MLLMQQHSALEKSEQTVRGGMKREGRRKEEKGGKRRKGEGTARTLHGNLLSPNIAFGREKKNLLLNEAGNQFVMVQDGKGMRYQYDHLGSKQRVRRKKCVSLHVSI